MENKIGRPLKFKSVDELQSKIDEYFALCDPHVEQRDKINKDGDIVLENYITDQKPYTITGLALHLDTSRQTLINYEEKEEYFDTIKRAKLKCEDYGETALFIGKNPTGAIFNLVNNYGWENKSRNEVTGKNGDPIKIEEVQSQKLDNLQNILNRDEQ